MNPGISALRSTDFSDVLSFNRSTISLAHDLKVPDILRLLSSSIGATVCSCTLRREGWGKVDVAFHGLDATHQRMFKQKYFPRNSLTEWPESAEARKCLPVVANPTFVSNNSYISSEFYCQFMRPLGMHQIMVIILKSSSLHRVIGMWRSEDEKPFGQREQVKAELIVPALSAAIEETDPIGYLSHFGELIDIFDPFFDSDGFVVLSKDLKPLYMNGPAVELLSLLSTSNDAPECIGGRMLPRSLSAAIQARLALRDIEPSASGEVEFQLQSPRTAANVKVQLLPVRRESGGGGIVLRLKHEQPIRTDAQRLHDLGVSAREIDVIHGVANGLTNSDIGERLCISHHTVQTHLKKIYRKLNVGSRTALLRCVNQLPH